MPRVVVFDEFGGPDVMHVVEESAVEPAAGEVRVRIEAFAVNPLDQMMRSGASPAPIPLPHARLAITEAAAIWVAYSTAYGALVEKAGMRPGDHVLITAASGGVGRAAMQIANQIGAVPIAVTRHTAKKDALLGGGAAAVIATDRMDVG